VVPDPVDAIGALSGHPREHGLRSD